MKIEDDDEIGTARDALDELDRSARKIDESNWGPWKLDRSTKSVYMEGRPATYSLQISNILGDVAFYMTFAHLSEKTWADNECLGGLVRAIFAIEEAFDDPLHERKNRSTGVKPN